MHTDTQLARAGLQTDNVTGALSTPIYQCATFAHPALGQSTGFDYSRTANPTRRALEEAMATVDGGARSYAFSSGMAALDAVLRLAAETGRRSIIITEDPYGGTVRLADVFFRPNGVCPIYVDTSDTSAVSAALDDTVAAVLVETPSNPLLRVADIPALSSLTKSRGSLLVVDNTFLTPCLMKPLELGADIAVYSATKYLGGHNDLLAGVATCKEADMGQRLAYIQNATGAVLGPMDAWLLLRGMKTLSVRMERQQQNALAVAQFLSGHPRVPKVLYPGLPDHPGHELLGKQSRGFGAMVAFETDDERRVADILSRTRIFSFAESLGGVESLITFPAVQTHSDISPPVRERLGINNRLLRLSVGIEDKDDLIADLDSVL